MRIGEWVRVVIWVCFLTVVVSVHCQTCNINKHLEPDQKTVRWHVRVKAQGGEFQLLAIEETRMKAFKRCDKWLTKEENAKPKGRKR